jgi:DNA-binding NarL/FixJ family response regulator
LYGLIREGVVMGKIRVVLADDHPLIRQGIVSTVSLESDLEVVDQAADGDAAIISCREKNPDVLVLDVGMPGPNTPDIVKTVQKDSPSTKVLILTAYDDDIYIRQLLKVGVSGYLLKDEGIENVVRAIRAIHGGATWFSQTITEKFVRWQYGDQNTQLQDLTDRERQVLDLIADGLDNGEIAVELDLAEQTVKNYASSIYEKIKVHSRAQAVIWARDNLDLSAERR